jgi:hypothetical protein
MIILSQSDCPSSEAVSEQPVTINSSTANGVPDELFRLKLNTIVKPYKNAQNRSGESLGIIEINISSVDAF